MAMRHLLSEGVPTACTTIEEVGSTGVGALTVGFIIFAVCAVVFLAKANTSGEQRKYYICSTYICGFAAMAYFAMLSGQGWTAIAGCRQFFYARFADYIVTMPLLILLLGQVAAADIATIAATIGAASVWVISTYMGSVSVVTTVKWFWFLLSLAALAGVIVALARSFKEASIQRYPEVAELYGKAAWLIILCFFCYPAIWLFSEGFASFSVSFEICAYTILDVISKVVVSFMVMSGHDILREGPAGTKDFF
jgi:bacteriorhodopsin